MGKRGKKKACACLYRAETSADAAMSRKVCMLKEIFEIYSRNNSLASHILSYHTIIFILNVKIISN